MTFVKFCGFTREADVRAACEMGVHALGFVLWPSSPRHVGWTRLTALVQATAADVLPVGVFVDPSSDDLCAAHDAGIRVAQIHHRDGSPAQAEAWRGDLWTATSLDRLANGVGRASLLVLDAHDPVRHGGTGQTIDWTRAAGVAAGRKVLLAGGLTPGNVATAIRIVRPYGVDVSSGIEQEPGIKDTTAMQAFMAAVREADRA